MTTTSPLTRARPEFAKRLRFETPKGPPHRIVYDDLVRFIAKSQEHYVVVPVRADFEQHHDRASRLDVVPSAFFVGAKGKRRSTLRLYRLDEPVGRDA